MTRDWVNDWPRQWPPRSKPYREGFSRAFKPRTESALMALCPYAQGTAEWDAFMAGADHAASQRRASYVRS